MFGGRSFLKRRASSIARKHTPTRHFPTRKTTRTALKTTLSIKRARKIQPHIPDLPLNLAPFLPRGAHIFGFFRSTRKSKKQKTKENKKRKSRTTSFLLYAVNCIVALCVCVMLEEAANDEAIVSGFCCCAFKLRSNACS
jgi:hypothetical protein